MIAGLQLPFRFDPELLRSDLSRIQPGEWTPHYNERDYGGDWHGVALRSLSGDSRQLLASQGGSDAYADTGVLCRSPYLREVLSTFRCPLKSVRLLRLGPGSVIREHADPALGFEDGEVRIHIPVQTNSGVEFCLAGEPLQFKEGNCYYINVSLPHRVSNRGSEARIHLVIDADVNDWVRGVFGRSQPVGTLPASLGSVGSFRKAVLQDPSLQQKLHAAADWKEFIGIGRDLGFDLEGWRGFPGMAADRRPGLGWIPVSLYFESGRPLAEWMYFGSRRFTEPFFEDSVRAASKNPFALAFRHKAPLSESLGMNPSGFIFHMSRCGSTLISRTLASIPRVLVISEAAPIDSAIRTNNVDWLRWTVHALGQRRANETHYFIKLDAWHIHSLPLIRKAFPETPWVFVYRDPLEVLVSQSQTPGKLALPGAMEPQRLGLSSNDIINMAREEWCARVLAGFCESALAFMDDPQALFIDYRQLPDHVWGRLSKHFDIAFSSDEVARIQSAARFDAKSPSRPFEPDSARKQSTASAALDSLAERCLNPLYAELQKLTLHA